MSEQSDEREGAERRRDLARNLGQVMLRMLPLIPGPEIAALITDLSRSRTRLDDKIRRAADGLHETSQLISELEADLQGRLAKLDELKSEYSRYSQLAEIEENKARALVQQLELSLGRGRGRERMISLLLNLLAGVIVFVLGVIAGPALTRFFGLSGS